MDCRCLRRGRVEISPLYQRCSGKQTNQWGQPSIILMKPANVVTGMNRSSGLGSHTSRQCHTTQETRYVTLPVGITTKNKRCRSLHAVSHLGAR